MQRCRQSSAAKQQWTIPLSLLDLTLAQARPHHGHSQSNVLLRRYAHALALKSRTSDAATELLHQSQTHRQTRIGTTRLRPSHIRDSDKRPALAKELENSVDALVGYRQEEGSLQEAKENEAEALEDIHYSESELQSFYSDVLAHDGPSAETTNRVDEAEDLDPYPILDGIAERLLVTNGTEVDISSASSSSLSSRLKSDGVALSSKDAEEQEEYSQLLQGDETHRRIISRLLSVFANLEQASNLSHVASVVPISVLSDHEWRALVQVTAEKGDLQLAELALSLCLKSGSGALEDALEVVLSRYASSGKPELVASLLKKLEINEPSERQRDRHIKAHLRSSASAGEVVSDSALASTLATIHDYESRGLAPPIKSYSRTISALFYKKSTQFQAQGWDLFAHMRYVAHPTPDAFLYAQMMRACAGIGPSHASSNAEPERALDLWTEMVNDAKITPTDYTYNGIIFACARSTKYATEAFRFAREMLDSHRDAFGKPSMHPDRKTFIALLVAAKSLKDLGRARWLLAEILKMHDGEREGPKDDKRASVAPDTDILVHVFNTYTAYTPPFKRSNTRIVEDAKLSTKESDVALSAAKADAPNNAGAIDTSVSSNPFGVTPPRTRTELLQEADILLERIFQDRESKGTDRPGPFSDVRITSTLLNAYICIYLRHAPIESARKVLHDTLKRAGIEQNGRSCVHVLERCGYADKGDDRKVAQTFAQEAWEKWQAIEQTLRVDNVTSRVIERAHGAMIRFYALVNDLDRAMALVRAFVARYPPAEVASPPATPAMRSSRTILYADRPVIRLTTSTEIPDDSVPPVLTFRDLESLHARLVMHGWKRSRDIGYLKYVAKAYEGNMRKRRKEYLAH